MGGISPTDPPVASLLSHPLALHCSSVQPTASQPANSTKQSTFSAARRKQSFKTATHCTAACSLQCTVQFAMCTAVFYVHCTSNTAVFDVVFSVHCTQQWLVFNALFGAHLCTAIVQLCNCSLCCCAIVQLCSCAVVHCCVSSSPLCLTCHLSPLLSIHQSSRVSLKTRGFSSHCT